MRQAAVRYGKRTAARIRDIRRKAAEWKRRARRGLTLALVTAGIATAPSLVEAQMGQTAMVPAEGIVNRAVAGFQSLNGEGPGWLYYGVNAADRGLGYRGSYMTLGGFIPYAQDDLGGFWSADLRTHLSNYGGFFSNVGLVRKQFIEGTVLGLGVYWDYDGDQNQYQDSVITDPSGSYVFAGGQTYQQVGVSGEWLTDWGNLRTNGYMPVGVTSETMGPLVGYSLLCQSGINAALGGTDLEVGAYVPGLSDWAGMVSVGGYAYGNNASLAGNAVVPWFGGVYTRLDMTFLENWDFSLQANNDSYFDWTGFARLSYRMGKSRRRNVPDQIEQPMMRNEHIVRAHQEPVQAINPATSTPWFVYHVDNSTNVAPGGNGSSVAPFRTLTEAQAAATNPYDIVFVHNGNSQNGPYEAPGPSLNAPSGGYWFAADNQYLVGEGTSLRVPTSNCGLVPIWSSRGSSSAGPRITNPIGPAIILTDNTANAGTVSGATVSNLTIVGSQVGISDGGGLPTGGIATVDSVTIIGTGPNQRGVEILDSAGNGGRFHFNAMNLQNLTFDGFFIDGSVGGRLSVAITDSTISGTDGSGVVVTDLQAPGVVSVTGSTIQGSSRGGVFVGNGTAYVGSTTFAGNRLAGVYVQNASARTTTTPPTTAGISTVQVDTSTFTGGSVGIWAFAQTAAAAAANTGVVNLTATGNDITTNSDPGGTNGIILAVSGAGSAVNAALVGNTITPRFPVLQESDDGITYDQRGNIVLGTTLNGSLNVKASSREQLESMNNRAGVTTAPLPSTATPPTVPPPPNYNAATVVPLPPPP